MKKFTKYAAAAAIILLSAAAVGCSSDTPESQSASQTAEETEAITEDTAMSDKEHAAVITVPETIEVFEDQEEASFNEPSEESAVEEAPAAKDIWYENADADEEIKAGFIDESIADGDIVIIGISNTFLDCTVKYGNVILLEEESTSDSLYFQGVKEGKDNIVISESGPDGVAFSEYTVIVNEDLSVDLYPANDFSLYTEQ